MISQSVQLSQNAMSWVTDSFIPVRKVVDSIHPVLLVSASTVSILTAAASVYYMKSSKKNKKYQGQKAPPHVKHYIPFFGSMFAFGMDPITFLETNRNLYGDIFTFTMFGREMTFALGADGNHLVFNAKLSHANAEQAYNSLTKPVFGANVVYDVDHQRFMDQKKVVKLGMSHTNLRAYVGMIEDETVTFLQGWKGNDIKDLHTALAELTIMTASRCLMGPEVRACLDKTVAQLYHDLDQGFQPINFLFEWLPLPSYWRRDIAHKKMRDLFFTVMDERRKLKLQDKAIEYNDIFDTFMTTTYRDGQQVSDEEAAHLMIALLMAGQHTSSTTGTWILSYLIEHPQVWDDLYQQLQMIAPSDQPLTYDILKDCALLDAVVRETLRLRPPLTSIMRKVVLPMEFQGYVIPQGHYLCAAPVISHYDPTVFNDPMAWNPYRWLTDKIDEGGQQQDFGFGAVNSARSSYLPFGAGRHRCIGDQFAYVQLKSIIATFVREFESIRFAGGSKFPNRNYTSMVVMPEKNVMVEYTRRSGDKLLSDCVAMARSDSVVGKSAGFEIESQAV